MQIRLFKFLLVVFLAFASDLAAQKELLNIQVDTTTKIPNWGPNRRHYFQQYIGLGIMPGPMEKGAKTNWWSTSLLYGYRYKLKLWSWNALVVEGAYRHDRYSINQKQTKLLPVDPLRHQRERISLHNITGAFYDRINLGKRGNVLGRWIDLGVYADYAFRVSHVYLDQYYDSNSFQGGQVRRKTRVTRLPFANKLNYGASVRYGSYFYAIWVNYRMTDIIKYPEGATATPDLPKIVVGMEFSIYWLRHL
ncbi:MAG: hypothetical protein ACRCYO_00240 [Bacteroidia bacterium]